jgi:anaerobic magnesium-protoporphyrin IX monomethyl ester cyclase
VITLIIPPSPFLISDKVFPSLGILYVASALEQKGCKVRVLDLTGQQDWQDKVREIANQDYRLIGITATTPDFPLAIQILNIIKSVNVRIPIVIGGPHATVASSLCEMFDKVVVGDGWTGIFLALETDQKIVRGEMIANLDEVPLPARHLIDLKNYHYEIDGRMATNVISQLGCPFSCVFCCGRDLPQYRRVRVRGPRSFVEELDLLNEKYGYTAFMIHDDEFNLKKSRTLEICELLSKRDYRFRCFVRADLFTEEIAKAMAKAGFYEVDVGVESGSARILGVIRKDTTPEINARARLLARKYGMKFKAFITIGHPSETHEDVLMTKQWLLDNEPDGFEIYVITPYPGAPIYDQKEKFDLDFSIDYGREAAFVTRRYGDSRCYVRTSSLTSEEIAILREEVDKEVRAKLGIPSPREASLE